MTFFVLVSLTKRRHRSQPFDFRDRAHYFTFYIFYVTSLHNFSACVFCAVRQRISINVERSVGDHPSPQKYKI